MSRLDHFESLDREELLYLAWLAEQSERYEEMVEYATAVVKKDDKDLSIDERYTLSRAYKNAVGTLRQAWRVLHSIEIQEEHRNNPGNKTQAEHYRRDIETQLTRVCGEILRLLDERLLVNARDTEARVFYHKMKGDYYRFLSEFAQDPLKAANSQKSHCSYQDSMNVASNELPPTHPIRLGLALSFSVFNYEILQNKQKAFQNAKQAFDDAMAELDNITEESYKECTLIMQLLRDNLTLWTSEANR